MQEENMRAKYVQLPGNPTLSVLLDVTGTVLNNQIYLSPLNPGR
jgi:hypothetical protein